MGGEPAHRKSDSLRHEAVGGAIVTIFPVENFVDFVIDGGLVHGCFRTPGFFLPESRELGS